MTWNPSDIHNDASGVGALSNGNLTFTCTGAGTSGVRATIGKSSGKWYFEIHCDTVSTGNNSPQLGIATLSASIGPNIKGTDAWCQQSAPLYTFGNASYKYSGLGFSAGSVFNCAYDMGAGSVWFGVNGTYYNSGNPATGSNPTWTGLTAANMYAAANCANCAVTARFASASWGYTAPSGFLEIS
jgi:hypothetical protein